MEFNIDEIGLEILSKMNIPIGYTCIEQRYYSLLYVNDINLDVIVSATPLDELQTSCVETYLVDHVTGKVIYDEYVGINFGYSLETGGLRYFRNTIDLNIHLLSLLPKILKYGKRLASSKTTST